MSRAIVISLAICVVIYFLVALAVGSNPSIPQKIIEAKDYSLPEAARPLFGNSGCGLLLESLLSQLLQELFSVFLRCPG